MIRAWSGWLDGRPAGWVLLPGLVAIGLLGVLDYLTGPQISASLFYLIPVLLVTRFAGAGRGVLAALAASITWMVADLLAPAEYNHPLAPYWNATMRFGVFLTTVWLVAAMRSLNTHLEDRVRERTAALEAETQERRQLEKRILEISDREQARIGQDLHDGLCQHLVGTAFSANLLRERLAAQAHPEAEAAGQISTLLYESITQARGLARGLYPMRVEADGLALALEELATQTSTRYGVVCTLDCSGKGRLPDGATAIHLYRIAQEAVANAVKHARAQTVLIRLATDETQTRLTVEDNGVGFHPHSSNREGMGLHTMEYRARMIGGVFNILPGANGGTCVVCRLGEPHASN